MTRLTSLPGSSPQAAETPHEEQQYHVGFLCAFHFILLPKISNAFQLTTSISRQKGVDSKEHLNSRLLISLQIIVFKSNPFEEPFLLILKFNTETFGCLSKKYKFGF